MFISKKRWVNLVNRVERIEKAINLADTSSPLHQMKTALKEVFESDVHPKSTIWFSISISKIIWTERYVDSLIPFRSIFEYMLCSESCSDVPEKSISSTYSGWDSMESQIILYCCFRGFPHAVRIVPFHLDVPDTRCTFLRRLKSARLTFLISSLQAL